MMGVMLSLYLALNSLPSIVRTFLFGAWNTGFAYGLLARVNSSINRILKGEVEVVKQDNCIADSYRH